MCWGLQSASPPVVCSLIIAEKGANAKYKMGDAVCILFYLWEQGHRVASRSPVQT
ncbi:hypothetical protein CLOSTMETH_00540 [[Clostridium] methylpentosum DSM 5476]|uniref:Uncharacterized protein n=1 Tax=[Clostridium] methylpentosum DSM 5476 TaxID=537013 RepID=C0E9P2_9FIRM|nr:hypothetical protein CLOSTMETH_00540 [[Clostridium] methylpentosum DSM 5476]